MSESGLLLPNNAVKPQVQGKVIYTPNNISTTDMTLTQTE